MRIAVLGLGFMGSTHLKALRSIPGAELAAVYSRDARKLSGDLSAIQGNIGGPGEKFDFSAAARYTEIEDLLGDPKVDAIDICLPTNLHTPVAIEAMRAGKHVLVEKPMALDGDSARAMIAEARKHGRVLMTAQVLRFFPMYELLRDVVRSGELGAVRLAMFRRRCAAPAWSGWLADAEQSGGGVFDLLIHDVDMCLHLFGKPRTVSATGYEALNSGVDIITAELHYPGLGTAFITGGWHHPASYPFSMEYTVVMDGGTVDYSSLGRAPSLYRSDGTAQELPMCEKDGYRAEIEYFIDCCHTGSSPALCPAEESADAVALTRLLLEARNRNGERISCQL
jgi:predicted dehydrogenase